MSLSLIFIKEQHLSPDVYCVILPSCLVSPGTLLLIACLCIVAHGGICSSRTPAGNCIWIVSIAFVLHAMHIALCCINYKCPVCPNCSYAQSSGTAVNRNCHNVSGHCP